MNKRDDYVVVRATTSGESKFIDIDEVRGYILSCAKMIHESDFHNTYHDRLSIDSMRHYLDQLERQVDEIDNKRCFEFIEDIMNASGMRDKCHADCTKYCGVFTKNDLNDLVKRDDSFQSLICFYNDEYAFISDDSCFGVGVLPNDWCVMFFKHKYSSEGSRDVSEFESFIDSLKLKLIFGVYSLMCVILK